MSSECPLLVDLDSATWERLCEIAEAMGQSPEALAARLVAEQSRDLMARIAAVRDGGVGVGE